MAVIELKLNPSPEEMRRFSGLWFPGFLVLLGLLAWHRSGLGGGTLGLVAAAGCVATATILSGTFARLLYFGCIYAAYPIGWVVSHLLLMGIYYLVMTPIGLLIRATGRDPLHRRFEESADTYWSPRKQPSNVRRYFRQY